MSLGLQATVDVLLFFSLPHMRAVTVTTCFSLFSCLPRFSLVNWLQVAAAPPEAADRGGGGAPSTGRRGEAKVPQEGPCPRDYAPPPHLYFNLNLNSLLFLLPLPAPPLSRSSADEIGPQARRPGSEGTADLAVSGAGPLLTEVRGRQRPAPHPQVVPEVSGHREGAGFEDGGRGPGKKAVG